VQASPTAAVRRRAASLPDGAGFSLTVGPFIQPEGAVPTPNYGYEKRQKELAKKRKKEDKLKAKADRKAGLGGPESGDEPAEEAANDAAPAADPPAQA
jgi:hypothetical protein